MINKKLATALGLSVALSLSACGNEEVTQAEPANEQVEESTPAPVEETKEPEKEEVAEDKEEKPTATPEVAEDINGEEAEFDIEPIEPEAVMYATQNCNVRSGPSTEYEIVSALTTNQEVTVNGKVTADNGKVWYVIKTEDNSTQMVSGSLLSATKVSIGTANNNGSSGSTNNGSTGGGAATIISDCQAGDCEGDCSVPDSWGLGCADSGEWSCEADAGGIVAY